MWPEDSAGLFLICGGRAERLQVLVDRALRRAAHDRTRFGVFQQLTQVAARGPGLATAPQPMVAECRDDLRGGDVGPSFADLGQRLPPSPGGLGHRTYAAAGIRSTGWQAVEVPFVGPA